MNDWGIKRFFKLILTLQLAFWGVIGLAGINLQVPILRPLVGFIYLTFVPGILILRILKLHKLGNIETVVYTVGLSLATLMFTGFLINRSYPLFGISKPLSLVPLTSTISFVVIALCVICYVRDKDFSDFSYIDLKDMLSPPFLFLCLIPFLSIFGTYLVNFYHNNIILMFLMVIIVMIVVLISFDKFFPKNLFPFAIFIISIAILYHESLISSYFTGTDHYREYYFSNLALINSYWDSTVQATINAMLSITILPVIFSRLLDMEVQWILKILYPLFFSLLPLGLYQIYQEQTDGKTAFLSVFFFISFFTFFTEMNHLGRQQIAELFFLLIILLLMDKRMIAFNRAALLIIFSISMIVSHYGLSYIYLFYIIMAWFLLFIIRADKTVNTNYILIYLVAIIGWYMYISSSVTFNTLIHLGEQMYNTVYTEFFVFETRDERVLQAIGFGFKKLSLQHRIAGYIHQITHLLIIIGVSRLIVKHKKMNFNQIYVVMVLISTVLLSLCVVLPYFASYLNMTRIYHITLIFLSPFCIIGGNTVTETLSTFRIASPFSRFKIRRSIKTIKTFINNKKLTWFHYSSTSLYDERKKEPNRQINVVLVLLILIPYFLFNTGFIFEVTGESSSSVSLSLERLINSDDRDEKATFYRSIYVQEQDIFSAKWLSEYRRKLIWADASAWRPLCYAMITYYRYLTSTEINIRLLKEKEYIYLMYWNSYDGLWLEGLEAEPVKYRLGAITNTTEIISIVEKSFELYTIYTNGYSEVYYIGQKK